MLLGPGPCACPSGPAPSRSHVTIITQCHPPPHYPLARWLQSLLSAWQEPSLDDFLEFRVGAEHVNVTVLHLDEWITFPQEMNLLVQHEGSNFISSL